MATISVRVEEDLKDKADEAAAAADVSVSEWTRQLMRRELGLEVASWSAPASLPKRDRAQLVLLHRLVQLLSDDPDEVAHQSKLIEVLEHGFTGGYPDEFTALYDELPLEDCRLMWDILDMFRVIGASIKEIGAEEVWALDELAEHALQFRGFDFNDEREGRFADYAAHLVRNGGWDELAVHFDDEHEHGNSHGPMLTSYLRMKRAFDPIWASVIRGAGRGHYQLNKDELLSIVKAAYAPR